MVNSDGEEEVSTDQIDEYLKHFVQRGRGPSRSKRLVKEEAKREELANKLKDDDLDILNIDVKDCASKVGNRSNAFDQKI